mmetsp:Transcript_79410/g.132973  ORF Transcript_79410/g.132973 Transcript_79410/m.132973 type:complete len:282 (-) Transcript_79410:613-1458(-)
MLQSLVLGLCRFGGVGFRHSLDTRIKVVQSTVIILRPRSCLLLLFLVLFLVIVQIIAEIPHSACRLLLRLLLRHDQFHAVLAAQSEFLSALFALLQHFNQFLSQRVLKIVQVAACLLGELLHSDDPFPNVVDRNSDRRMFSVGRHLQVRDVWVQQLQLKWENESVGVFREHFLHPDPHLLVDGDKIPHVEHVIFADIHQPVKFGANVDHDSMPEQKRRYGAFKLCAQFYVLQESAPLEVLVTVMWHVLPVLPSHFFQIQCFRLHVVFGIGKIFRRLWPFRS